METLALYQIQMQILCSYPTYEEWKLLPSAIVILESNVFLSYLWGMETKLIHNQFSFEP